MEKQALIEQGIKVHSPSFYFSQKYLSHLAKNTSASFRENQPFPHCVIDNFLPNWVADKLLEDFRNVNESQVDWYKSPNESRLGKKSTNQISDLPQFTRQIISELNSSEFLHCIEKISGFEHLITDPHAFGGGWHETSRHGLLKIHTDNNWDTKLLAFRRLNLIYFLNKDWKQEYGGDLELWDENMQKCKVKVAPIFNRCVIFANNEKAFHGHPEPLHCPENMVRRSIALYYYSSVSDGKSTPTLPHSTIYRRRPGEIFRRRKVGKRLLQRFLPPVILDILRYRKLTKKNHNR